MGPGIVVSHQPLNKAAVANSCLSVISWVLGQAQGLREGEEETEAFGGGLAGHQKSGLVSPNCHFVHPTGIWGKTRLVMGPGNMGHEPADIWPGRHLQAQQNGASGAWGGMGGWPG